MQSPTNKFLNLERVSLLLLRSFPYKKAAEAASLLNILQNLFNISFTINNTYKIHVLFLFVNKIDKQKVINYHLP